MVMRLEDKERFGLYKHNTQKNKIPTKQTTNIRLGKFGKILAWYNRDYLGNTLVWRELLVELRDLMLVIN
jgi:hypothetical protein